MLPEAFVVALLKRIVTIQPETLGALNRCRL
jgi:hypothetical protein